MRWRAAGNESDLRVWPECVHAFLAFPLSLARQAHGEQHDFLRRALAD
jgi:acetyl esterase/lipase